MAAPRTILHWNDFNTIKKELEYNLGRELLREIWIISKEPNFYSLKFYSFINYDFAV